MSVDSLGNEGNANSLTDGNISADGRYVVFRSDATNLVPGDTNGVDREVFVRDRVAGTTERVSVGTGGTEANEFSDSPWISADGRYVVFRSAATNLVPGDTNGVVDIFLHDRLTNTTQRVSVTDSEGQANNGTDCPRISGDGQVVVFSSEASNLVPGDSNGFGRDTFVRDLQTGTTERIAHDTNACDSISTSGRFVTFYTQASDIVPGDTNGTYDVFVYDRQTDVVERVSVDSAAGQSNGFSGDPFINDDGRYVAFHSTATNLVSGDTNGELDVFVRDRQAGTTQRVSVDSSGGQANSSSQNPGISADGAVVTFASFASNLVSGDTNSDRDVFVHVLATGTTERASVSSNDDQASGTSGFGTSTLTADGGVVMFDSSADNLVPDDTNGIDVFVRDRQPTPADTTPPIVTGNPDRAANGNGWYNASVTIDWTSEDPDPSSGTPSDPPDTNANTEGADVEYTSAPSCDPANNCATGSLTLSIDLSDPIVTCDQPPPTFTQNQAGAMVTATVTDNVSGPVDSSVSATADTSTPGPGTVELTGTDLSDRSTTVQCPYVVVVPAPQVVALGDAHMWVGLKNSDDQGTQFDVRVELLKNGTVVASGVQRCVIGVTRNPAQAKDAVIPWGSFPVVTLNPGDVMGLRVSTRIGTNANDTKCGPPGHNNAVGLRLYYDATTRNSRFGATITPNPSTNEYLRSDGNACVNAESTGVTTRYLSPAAPTAASAKCKDSSSINFAGGNLFQVIGTWSAPPQP